MSRSWLCLLAIGVIGLDASVVAQEAADRATIVVNAGNDQTAGAAIRLDGEPAGNVPARLTVSPGRHLVQVGKRGFTTFSEWYDIRAGQVLTVSAVLHSQGIRTGSLLVSADVTGAPVYVDGKQRGGTPVVVTDLSEGDHVVEIKPRVAEHQAFSQVVRITAGEQAKVEATLLVAPGQGSLRVITNAPGAIVTIDGIEVGPAPAARGNLAPGDHIVSARAPGYESISQSVSVVGGRERVISLRLTLQETQGGQLVVRANVPEATVWVNGENKGTPPVFIESPDPGNYSIVIKAPGYREVRRTCRVAEQVACEIDATLNPIGAPLRIESNVPNAEVFIDGVRQGTVPWEGDVEEGTRRVEVRAENHESSVQTISVKTSDPVRLIHVVLARVGVEKRSDEYKQRELEAKGATSHSAAPLPKGVTTLDLSLGWVHLAEVGLTTSILKFLDAGLSIRTYGRLTDFELNTKLGWRPVKVFSAGSRLRVGGGVGPSRNDILGNKHKTNDFFVLLEFLMSFHFGHAGAISAWFGLDFTSDSWAFQGNDRNALAMTGGRQNLFRGRLGGSLDFVLSRRWNFWFLLEGMVFGGKRNVYGDVFGAGKSDIEFYPKLGFTYKFGGGGAK